MHCFLLIGFINLIIMAYYVQPDLVLQGDGQLWVWVSCFVSASRWHCVDVQQVNHAIIVAFTSFSVVDKGHTTFIINLFPPFLLHHSDLHPFMLAFHATSLFLHGENQMPSVTMWLRVWFKFRWTGWRYLMTNVIEEVGARSWGIQFHKLHQDHTNL